MKRQLTSERNLFKIVSLGTVAAIIIALTLISLPQYWKNIIYEKSPMTWFESVILFACAFTAFLNVFLIRAKTGRINFVWVLFTIAFSYLACDERFMIHEGIRERILKPHNVHFGFLPWVEKGDYALLIFMLMGLSIVPVIWKELRSDKEAIFFFIAAVFFSAAAVGIDTIDLRGISLHMQYVIQYLEEVSETAGMICFFNCFMMKFFEKITLVISEEKMSS